MVKAEVIAPVMITVNPGSTVLLSEAQLERVKDCVKVIGEKKKSTKKTTEE